MKRTIRYGTFETNSSSMHNIIISKTKGPYTKEELYDGIYVRTYDNTLNIDEYDLCFGRAPFQLLCTFYDKFRYAIAEFCGDANSHKAKENADMLCKILQKYIPEAKHVRFPVTKVEHYIDEDGNDIDRTNLEYCKYTLYRYEINGKVYENVYDTDMRYTFVPDIYKSYFTDDPFELTAPSGLLYTVKGKKGKVHFAKKQNDMKTIPDYGSVDHQSRGLLERFLQEKNISIEEFLTNRQYIIAIDGDEYCVLDEWLHYGLLAEPEEIVC
ncbi:MAG: hypothetical protein SPL66_06020 [Lachnospiraceae bacterium]|nr:hypothetical protein [Lachnospiraceae bacterium]